jgi:hypothetical protein
VAPSASERAAHRPAARPLAAALALVAPAAAAAQAQAVWEGGVVAPLVWFVAIVLGISGLLALAFFWMLVPRRIPRPPGADR